MPLTVTLESASPGCVDVRWSPTPTPLLSRTRLGLSQQSSVYLVTAAPGGNAAATGRGWTVVVTDSMTSAVRLMDLEQAGLAGTPAVTVRHCRVTRSEAHGVDQWTVMEVGDGTTGDDGIDTLKSLFGRFSLSSASSTTSPPGDKTFTLPLIADRVIVTEEANKIGLVRPSVYTLNF